MFNLTAQVARHPIADEPYLRHLRTADVFNAINDAREEWRLSFNAAVEANIRNEEAIQAEKDAFKRYEAEHAKAKLMQSMEDL